MPAYGILMIIFITLHLSIGKVDQPMGFSHKNADKDKMNK